MLKLAAFVSVALFGAAQVGAAVITNENFESGTASGWTNNIVSDPGVNSGGFTKFLGQFGAESVSKTFAFSGTQTSVNFAFDIYRIDSWDNELFRIEVLDGNSTIYSNDRYYQHGGGTNTIYYEWDDAIDKVSFDLLSSATSLTLKFTGFAPSGIRDESYGIDNLRITDNSIASAVPEPASWAMMIGGMGLLGATMRRKRAALAHA